MATENEIQLKAHVDELQRQVNGLVDYLNFIIPTINQNADSGESFSTSFWSQQQVTVCLPFHASDDAIINVVVEETPGQYRQINPPMDICGQNLTINFDRPHTGHVSVHGGSICGMQISPPPNITFMGEVTLYEPALEPPIDPQPLTVKTSVGSEDVSEDRSFVTDVDEQNDIVEPKGFGKAMGAIKKWPR